MSPSVELFELAYPSIEWRKPIKVIRTDGVKRYGCRICIAKNGLKGKDIEKLWDTPEEVLEHIKQFH